MKTVSKKSILLLVALFVTTVSIAQVNNCELSIEYSPNLSNALNPILKHQLKLSHNAVFRIAFDKGTNIKPTLGIGLLHTGSSRELGTINHPQYISIKVVENYNYIVIPFGLKMSWSKLTILPEVGIGVNLSNSATSFTELETGETLKDRKAFDEGSLNKITVPLSLSIGTDVQLYNHTVSLGFKGYYAINRVPNSLIRINPNNYIGLGLFMALKL